MEELEVEEKLSNEMNKTAQDWQEEMTKVINHLLYESGYTIVHIRQSNKWIKLDSRGEFKRTEQEYVDTILNGATHSMVDRINEIVQLIGSNQEVYLEEESKKWMVRARLNPPDPPDPHVPDRHGDPRDRDPHHLNVPGPRAYLLDPDDDTESNADSDSDSDYYDYAIVGDDDDDDKMESYNMDKGKRIGGQEEDEEKERLTKGQDVEEEGKRYADLSTELVCPPISIPTRETEKGEEGIEIEKLEEKGEGNRKKISEARKLVTKRRIHRPGTIDGKVGAMQITKDGAHAATTQEVELGGPSPISKTEGRGMRMQFDEKERIYDFQIMRPGLQCLVPMEEIVLIDKMPLWSQLRGGERKDFMKHMDKMDINWIKGTVCNLHYNDAHFKKFGSGCTTKAQAEINANIMEALSKEGNNSKFELKDFELSSLTPGNWLFDRIINKYQKLLYDKEISDRGVHQARFFIFTTNLFRLLRLRNIEDWHFFFAWRSRDKVKEGVFSGPFVNQKVEFLLFPACNGRHFILLIFNIASWELLILDSQSTPDLAFHREAAFLLIMVIKNMLHLRAPERMDIDEKVTCFSPNCIPKQDDYSSCGVFTLLFIDAFSRSIDLTKEKWSHDDISNTRFKIALELLKGKLL